MKKFSRAYIKLLGMGLMSVTISAAMADEIEYVGPDAPSEAVNVSYAGQFSNLGTDAGFLGFQIVGTGTPFEAICGDIFHDISGTSTYSDTVFTASSTPPFGGASSGFTTAGSILGAGNIIGNNFDAALAANTDQAAAGLQIAVWAEEYDFASTITDQTSFNLALTSTGAMTISGTAAGDMVTMDDAFADWSTSGITPGGPDSTLFLKGGNITSGPYSGAQGQDQWTEQSQYTPSGSPEPFTLAIGTAGVGLAFRRRFSRKA